MNEKLNEYLDRAGDGAVVMISPADLPSLRKHSSFHEWHLNGASEFYRGALVEEHDEWSWGWMVRKSDGSFVEPREAA